MTPAAFPRAARLLTPRDFASLRGRSRRVGGTHFSAEVAPGTGTGARLGLAVSRKVSTRAVQRNRIKRVARDSFRRHRALLDTCDIVLIARPVAAAADNAVLHAELARLWLSIAALNATGRAGTMRA